MCRCFILGLLLSVVTAQNTTCYRTTGLENWDQGYYYTIVFWSLVAVVACSFLAISWLVYLLRGNYARLS